MIIGDEVFSLEEMVYKKLEDEILSGIHTRGKPLTEMSLTRRLGVSRTPVRGALHRLSEDGLVELIPNKGAVVVGVNTQDLVDIYNIRMRLEGLASKCSAARISDEQLKRLKESVELSEFYINKEDADKLKELDTQFHTIIYNCSGNHLLSKILTELHRKTKAYRRLSLSVPGRLVSSIEEHREIYEAIAEKDGERAESLTALHVQNALNNMLMTMKEE